MSKFKNYRVKKFQNANLYTTGSATEIISNETQVAESSVLDIGFDFVFNDVVYTKYKAFSTGFIQLLNSDIQANALDTSLTAPHPKTLWDFNTDNIDGTTLSDATGFAEGTVTGTPSAVTGIEGQAYDFDATNDTIACTQVGGEDLHLMDPNNASYSFSAWVKPAQNTAGYVFSKYYYRSDSEIVDRGYFLRFTDFSSNVNAKVNFTIYDRSTIDGVGPINIYAETASRITNIADGNWHHIVVTVESTIGTDREVKIYVDNVEYSDSKANLTTNSMSTAVHANWTADVEDNAFTIGSITDGGSYFDGVIDQLAVWESTVLTAENVTSLYNIGNRGLSVLHDNTVYNPGILYSRNSNIRGPILAPWLGKLVTWQGTYVPAEGMVDAYNLTDGIVTQLTSETGIGKRKRIISFRCREHFEDTSSNGTLLNFQIVLQENTNHIEFVYDESRQDGTPTTPLGAASGIGFSFSDFRNVYSDGYKFGGSIETQDTNLTSASGWQSNTKIKIIPEKSKTKLENKRRSQFLSDLDSDPYQYPVLKSPGDNERLGNVTTAFDDRNTVFYENNVKVSYPMNIPEGYSNINTKAASLTIGTGNIVKGVSSGKQFLTYLTHSLPELIKPFNDTGLYEENITDTFFLTGSSISDVGEGFDSSLKSKSKVVLKFPVGSSTSLHATLPTIAYYNLSTHTFDIKTYASATLQGNMMDPDGDGTQTVGTNAAAEIPYVTASNGVINQDGVIGAGHDCILFNSFGVPVNTTGKFIFNAADTFRYSGTASPDDNPGNQYSIFDSPRDFNEPGIYQYAVPNKLYSSSLKEIQNIQEEIVSPLTHKSWAATDSQKIIMSSSITEPFLLEKAVIKVPISAGDGWFDDRTRALHAGFDFKSFDIGGPAVTVSLLRQDRDDIREIILSGTIIPAGDNESRITAGNHDGTLGILENTDWDNGSTETDSNNRVYTNFWNGTSTFSNNKRNLGNFYTTSPPFLSRTDYGYAGFKSFSTPGVTVNPEVDPRTLAKSYSGDVVLSTKAGVVNGAYLVNTTTDSATSGSNVGLSNAKIFQVSNLGRTMNSVPSARNFLAGEFRMPSYQKDNDFSAGKNLTLTDGLYHPPRVYYRFTPDEGAQSGGSFTAVLDFMSGSSFTSFETTGSGGEVSTTGIFNHTVSDRDTIYFQSGSGDGLVRPSATNSDADYDIFSLFDGATDDIANNVKRGRSISFFAKIECAPVSPVSLLGREYFPGTASNRYGWRLKLNADATISLYVYDTNDELVEIIKTTSQIDDNQWHHIALTLETYGISDDFGALSHARVSKLRLYVDGVVQGIPLFHDVKFDSTGTGDVVYVAHSPDGEYAQLYMDELAYWSNAALSPSEISEIYNASQGGLPLYKTRRGSSPVYQYLEYTNSPYLLLPTDNIILAVSKTRPVRTTPVPDYKNLVTGSHDFTLKTGEVEIALYGSYVSQNRQKFTGLNQHLTNLSVHHVIGDEPVLDQFDVEKTLMLSGSYIDNIVTGSMVDVSRGRGPGELIYTTPTTANQRKVIGSNTNYNDQTLHHNIHSTADPKNTSNASYHLRFRFTGSLRTPHRNSVFYDKSEQFYDTLMPSFEKMLNKLGTSVFVYNTSNGLGYLSAVHSEGAGNPGYSSAGKAEYGSDVFKPLNDWYHRFPFENTFIDLKRVQDPFSDLAGFGVDAIPGSTKGKFKVKTLRVFQEGWTDTNTYFDNGPGGVDEILDLSVWRKFFYGFGDENTYSRVYKLTGSAGNSWDIKGNTNCPRHYGTNGTNNPVAPILIRGWKYGIQNGFAENTNVVFRRNRYGQFRDMLEQRHDGKFYKNETNLQNALGNPAVNASPVQIRFVDSEGNIVEPGSTDSSNQHFEATSSLPYFDDGADYERIRNRGPLPVTIGARTVNELIGLNFRS